MTWNDMLFLALMWILFLLKAEVEAYEKWCSRLDNILTKLSEMDQLVKEERKCVYQLLEMRKNGVEGQNNRSLM